VTAHLGSGDMGAAGFTELARCKQLRVLHFDGVALSAHPVKIMSQRVRWISADSVKTPAAVHLQLSRLNPAVIYSSVMTLSLRTSVLLACWHSKHVCEMAWLNVVGTATLCSVHDRYSVSRRCCHCCCRRCHCRRRHCCRCCGYEALRLVLSLHDDCGKCTCVPGHRLRSGVCLVTILQLEC
jgi:hypothetical protein